MPDYKFSVAGDGLPTATDTVTLPDLHTAKCAAVRLVGEFMQKEKHCMEAGDLTVDVSDAADLALFRLTVALTNAPAVRTLHPE